MIAAHRGIVARYLNMPMLCLLFATALTTHLNAQNPPTTVNVDANANRHPINSNIYGMNYADATDMKNLNLPLNRWGGNATSRYNWQIDAHSAGADWYFEPIPMAMARRAVLLTLL